MTLQDGNLLLRELRGLAELKHAEAFQKEIWGEGDMPDGSDILLAIQYEGGLVAGAFMGDRMLAFLFGFPTSKAHVHHSHRLAVHPDSRGLGLGLKLKWYQRDWCLKNGVTHVRWTYDPLRHINANLNIGRLGGTAGIYHQDYYGQMAGINAGVPSDRLLVDWELSAPHVDALATGSKPPAAFDVEGALKVEIPRDLDTLLATDVDKAISERLRVRDVLVSAFDEGYRITGFDRATSAYSVTKP